jgi:hypothetical protein
MAIGRISGALLFSDLDRQSTDLAFTTNGQPLAYMDFTNFRFGVNTNSVVDTFTVTGTANVSGAAKIFGNLIAASGTASSGVTTGALVVVGGAGVSGNLYAGNLFATNFSGNITNISGSSIFGNIGVTYAGAFGSVNTANAVITGGYVNGLANLTVTTAQIVNFSSGNILVTGGYISALANITATTGNVQSWYTDIVNATAANITTLQATNFSTGNAVISGGYISALTNAYVTTSTITNFSSGNILVSGGYISALANITATSGNVQSWYATTLNATASNITTGYTVNFSSGNAVISGGYISALANATIATANIGSVNFAGTTISSQTGNITISPLTSDGNGTVIIGSTSALQLPSGTGAQRPLGINAGSVRWSTTDSVLEYYNGTSWASLTGQINHQTITPDGINSSFTLDYSTVAEGIIVSINGTLQQPGVAYTVTGNQISFAEIPLVTDIISIRYIASGTVTAENAQEINSANVALTTTPVIVDSFDQAAYRSAKYMVTTTAANSAEFAEFALVHMGAAVAVSNVNRVITGSTLTMFIANISGTTVRLWANTVTGTANIKLQKTYFVV